MASREELLSSIHPGMKLTKNLFMRIYGYELTWEGFADQALTELEKAGCCRAREHYARIIGECEQKHEKDMKEVASWFRKKCDEEYENRKRKEVSSNRNDRKERREYKFNGLPQDW